MQTSEAFVCHGVTHEKSFDDAAETIFGTPRAADDALEGVLFTIARAHATYSSLGAQFGGHRIFGIKTRRTQKHPPVTVFYSCTETEIRLLEISVSEDPEEI